MKVLIAPAHYLFSDKYGSEPLWSYQLSINIANKLNNLDVLVGVIDITNNKIPNNLKLIPIFKSRNNNVLLEFIKKLSFYPILFIMYLKLSSKKDYEIVHHMLPLSIVTFNPALLYAKYIKKQKVIIGPFQLPQQISTKQDISIILTGKETNIIVALGLFYMVKIIAFFMKPLAYLTFNCADVIVCNSEESRKYYSKIFPLKKIITIPTGIEIPRLENINNQNNKEIKILCVGQLSARKGQIYLLEAFKKLSKEYKNISLTLVGRGELQHEYQKYILDNKLKATIIPGVPHEEIWKYYTSHSIFCLPSLSDPSPTVILEAMAYALPIVATNVGSVAEIVGDGGIIVKKEDPQQLYRALATLLKDKSVSKKKGDIGKSRIKDYYNWEIIAEKWVELYRDKI